MPSPLPLVPPALFHTLIENGITHSEGRPRHRVFRLHAERTPRLTQYTLIAPLPETVGPSLPPVRANGRLDSMTKESSEAGTGLRYVRARLEESFPGRWSMRAGATAEGWRTEIDIRPSK